MDNSTPQIPSSPGEETCNDLVARWQRGERVPVEAYLQRLPSLSDPALAFELILTEVVLRQDGGEKPHLDEYLWRFPDHAERLRRHFALHAALPTATLPIDDHLSAPRPASSPLVQTEIPGYEILDEVGSGAMGVVYRARQTRLNRLVALKVIVAWRLGESEQARFRIEAEALARLQHPNIVQIYDVGVHEGRPYLVCELVEGGNLADYLRRQSLTASAAAALVSTLAEAMHHAHSRDIVHRDLKPANILLASGDSPSQVKIADFGLAKLLDRTMVATRDGDVVGTPAYMAPEQATAKRDAVGVPTDVYALGAILYETLTGRAPFCAESPLATLLQVTQEEPLPPRRLRADVSRDLEVIALKCLEKDPRRRYPTALALAGDLGRWLRGEPIHARAISPWERGWRWAARHPLVASLAVVSILAVVLALVTLAVSNVRIAGEQEQTARALQSEKLAHTALADQVAREQQSQYLERVTLAQRMWLANQTGRANSLLASCPPRLRGWEWHYLDSLREANVLTLHGHRCEVTSLAYSRDGRLLASGGADGIIKLWDAVTGREEGTLVTLTHPITCLTFSPDGKQLAVAKPDVSKDPLTLWDVTTRKQLHSLAGDWWAAFSPDGALLASTSGRDVKLWDARTGQELRRMTGHTAILRSGCFSPDSKHLATGGMDQTVRLWDVATGTQIGKPRARVGPVYSLVYSPDGNFLMENVQPITLLSDARTGELLERIESQIRPQSNIDLSSDGQHVAYTGPDFTVKIWDLKARWEAHTFRGHTFMIRAVAFSPDGRRVASAGGDQTVRLWELPRDREVVLVERFDGMPGGITFSPDSRLLARARLLGESGGAVDDEVVVLDLATRRRLLRLPGRNDVIFSRDGRQLLTGSANRASVIFWDVETGRQVRTLKVPGDSCRRLLLSPDGRYLAVAGVNSLHTWDLTRDEPASVVSRSVDFLGGLAMHPEQALLAVPDRGGKVGLWDIAAGTRLRELVHPPEALAVSFSPDGRLLASAGGDGVIRLWDVRTGAALRSFHGHASVVADVAFSSDGRRLATGGQDRTVKLWDVESGLELLSLPGIQLNARRVIFSPDGRHIAAADAVGVKLWTSDPPR